jgi:hypothetical protein
MSAATAAAAAAAAAVAVADCGVLFAALAVVQLAEAERSLQLLKSQLLLAQAKQQSVKLQIKYSQVRQLQLVITQPNEPMCSLLYTMLLPCSSEFECETGFFVCLGHVKQLRTHPAQHAALCCEHHGVLCCAVLQMTVDTVEAELQKAMQLQASTSAALAQAVQDKLQAEAQLSAAMVRFLVLPTWQTIMHAH